MIAKFTSSWILDTTFGASGGYTDTNMGGSTGEGAYGLDDSSALQLPSNKSTIKN